VTALKSVDFPTFGNPTIPALSIGAHANAARHPSHTTWSQRSLRIHHCRPRYLGDMVALDRKHFVWFQLASVHDSYFGEGGSARSSV